MKTLLPILKTKLFLLSFVSACTVLLATTVPQVRNFITQEKTIKEKITSEQKKIFSNVKKQNRTASSLRVTSSVSLEMNNSFEATVTTDKLDYSPGEHVVIDGSGWLAAQDDQPGETVLLNIVSDCGCTNVTYEEIADANGHIHNEAFLITEAHIGASFVLTATGLTSGLIAITNFTDANMRGRTVSPTDTEVDLPIIFYGTAANCTGSSSASTFTADKNFDLIVAAIETQSLTLTAPATNSAGEAFRFWRVSGHNTGLKGTRSQTICVPGKSTGIVNITAYYGACAGSGGIPPVPTEVTATPSTICSGGSSNLNANAGNNNLVFWYTSPTSTDEIGIQDSEEDFEVTPTETTTYWAESVSDGGCISTARQQVTVTVTPNNTPGTASSTPTLCINTPLTNITHTTTGATGIGSATGLPDGVTAGFASNTVTISGTPTESGEFNYSVPLTGGCGTVSATGTITVTLNNTAGTASSTPSLCINTPLTNITHGTTGATGISNDGVSGANGLPAGVSATWSADLITISGTPTASGTFNYSILLTGGCGTVNATGTITVKTLSVAPTLAVSDVNNFCADAGGDIQLTASGGTLGTGAVVKWYSTSCGTGSVGTGNPLTIARPTTTTTYYALYEGDCNATTCASVQVTVKTLSVAPTTVVSDVDNFCADAGGNIQLTASGGSLGTGAIVRWYTSSCGGTAIGTGNPLIVNKPTTSTTYYALYQGDCNTTTCASVSVTVKTLSVAPTTAVSDVNNFCADAGGNIQLTASGGTLGTGAIVKWYTGSCGFTEVGTGSPLTISKPTATTTYYARYEGDCNVTACASVLVTVKTLSVAPTTAVSDVNNFCANAGGDIQLTASGGTPGTGAVVKWYSTSCGTGSVGTGNPLTIAKPTTTTTYYARYEGDCNVTACASVLVTVKTLSVAPTTAVSDVNNFCADAGGNIQLTASGGTIGTGAVVNWYSTSCGTGSVGTGNPLTIAKPTTTTTYYARYEGDCNATTCASVLVTVKTLSVAPTTAVSDVNNFCADAGGNIQLTASGGTIGTGAVVKWYSTSCGTGSVGTGNPLTIAKPTTTTTYYARYEGDCNMTLCASVLVTVKTLSVAATTATKSPTSSVCPGAPVTLGITGGSLGTGASWKWYSGSCESGTSAGTGASIVVNPVVTTTYYVRAEGDCNTTICRSVTVNVLAPTTIGDPEINGVDGTTTSYVYGCTSPTLKVTGSGPGLVNTYRWYKNTTNSNTGGTLVAGPSLTGTFNVPVALGYGTHYYYATYTSSCGTVASAVFVITITQQVAEADGKLYYNGTCMAWTPTATSNSATVTLAAFIKNNTGADDICGDIATARITFQVKNSSGVWTDIPSAQNLPVSYVDPNDPSKGGTANAIVQLNISNNTTQIFDLRVVVSGNYTANPAYGTAQITVSKLIPGGSISGGVVLCGNTSVGLLRPSTIIPSLLGFGVEYVVKGGKVQSPKGKVNLYVPSYYDLNGVSTFPNLNWYKISSNAIASLAITTPKATFTSKANVAKYNPATGETIPIEGNCTMVLDIEDISLSGSSNFQDKVGITVYKNAGGNWYSNNWVTSKTVPRNICGGDLTVSGTTNSAPCISCPTTMTNTSSIEAEVQVAQFNVRAFPNPSQHVFSLVLENATNEKVQIVVYDAIGRQVKMFEKQSGNIPIHFGMDLKVGVYVVEVRQGDNRKTLKLVKQ